MAYIGYFRSLHENNLYSVTLKKADDTSTPTEIVLAGDSPFVVRYEVNATPFDAFRNSTASISIISDFYFEDLLPSKPKDTIVILRNETTSTNEWVGYLTPKIYSQPYQNCLEQIELEASDCVSVLQYLEYESFANKSIVTFKDIIINIIDDTLLKGFYWPLTKSVNGVTVYPWQLKISEMNFFSSDTDEPWKLQEVLEEMCKYLGLTAIQDGEYLYFADYTALNNADRFQYACYLKEMDYTESTGKWSGSRKVITQKDLRGNGETIGFEPIYNKIVVKDNFYTCEDFISNIFDDAKLKNRGGEFFSSIEIQPEAGKPTYPWHAKKLKQKYVEDGNGDDIYIYFHRLYDHEDYESVYRFDVNLNRVYPLGYMNSSEITKNYVGGTIMDFGRVRKEYVNDAYQTIIANQIEWERYLCISQLGNGWMNFYQNYLPRNPEDNMVIFKLKDGINGQMLMNSEYDYLVINFKLLFTKYQKRNYINPDWTTSTVEMAKVSGRLIEGCGKMAFKLGIGGKYWNGETWQSTPCSFIITCTRNAEQYAYINEEKEVLNNVSWELNINEKGYKIPLDGIDTTQEIIFEFYLPSIQIITDFDGLDDTSYNGYCWIKDFSIKTVTIGQDKDVEESDVVYENIIDELNVNDLNEIELKFTTMTTNTKPSYSNVIYSTGGTNVFLDTIKESGLDGEAQNAEQNIIQKFYQQYSTPTKKLSYPLSLDFGLFDKFYGMDVENPDTGYVLLGTEIDFINDVQEITLVEKK